MSQQYALPQPLAVAQQRFVTQVFGWMFLGLTVTGFTSLAILGSDGLKARVFDLMQGWSWLIVVGLQLGLVIYLSARIERLSPAAARFLFLAYAASVGLTFAVVFTLYSTVSIVQAFFVSGGTFGLMFFVGWTTKRDLTSIGHIAFMGVLGIILASVVNWFLQATLFATIISIIGVVVFVALTAYDAQKIKEMQARGFGTIAVQQKAAVMGALRLYLDFINLFLFILRLLGSRR